MRGPRCWGVTKGECVEVGDVGGRVRWATVKCFLEIGWGGVAERCAEGFGFVAHVSVWIARVRNFGLLFLI